MLPSRLRFLITNYQYKILKFEPPPSYYKYFATVLRNTITVIISTRLPVTLDVRYILVSVQSV